MISPNNIYNNINNKGMLNVKEYLFDNPWLIIIIIINIWYALTKGLKKTALFFSNIKRH